MASWTKKDLENYIARQKPRSRPELQKQQDDSKGPVDNRPKETKMDGTVYPKFLVTVELLVSDNRLRDGDGAYTTLQDCLVSSIGRCLAVHPKALRKHAASIARGRRSNRNH